MASQLARRTLSYVDSSPVSRITLRWAGPEARFTSTISSKTSEYRPDRNAPRLITMSISSAPAATAARVSSSLTASGACPDGNAVATLATWIPVPRISSAAVATIEG
jgi:hypothetical protein